MASHLFNTYARMPVSMVRGDGAWLYDDQGRRYLDALSGIAVCSLGHAHPRLAEALCDQVRTLIHTANIVHIPQQETLATMLAEISGMDRVFMTNSGAESIECAIKLARRYGHERQIERPAFLVTGESFHGRTLAAMSASGNSAIQAGFGPLVDGYIRVPYGDLEAAEQALLAHPEIVGVLLEPIQGEGGVRVPPAGYLRGLRAACDRHEALLIMDEIQTGIGRTGRWFAFQHEPGLLPDIMTVAKALGNGVPVGACLARQAVADLLAPGAHGTTFGGNPLACRAGIEVLSIMRDEGIVEQAETLGNRLINRLRETLGEHPSIVEIRGRGLMVGIEFDQAIPQMKDAAMAKGLIINVTRGNVIRLLPPLIIDDAQLEQIVATLDRVIHEQLPVTA
ncbi:MAG: acetylornithine/succinylornithine family transaminase [Wenzhouxiangella sp.]